MKTQILLFLIFLTPAAFSSTNEGLDRAILFYEKGEYRKAVGLLSELSRSSPEESNVRLWLGKSYLKARDWDDAVQQLEKASQIQPSNALYRLWLGRACGARAAHSIFFTALRWARRVIKEFETAAKLAPSDLNIRFDMLDFYLNAPSMVGGGSEKASAEMQAIEKLDPRKGATARAMVFQKNKKYDQAKKELVQATIDYPNYADAYKDLADFLLDRKDYEEAFQNARKALALADSRHARLIAASSQVRLRIDLEGAEKTLRELAAGPLGDDDPSFEEVYFWLGECCSAKGEKDKAREAYLLALAFNPEYDQAKQNAAQLR
jgi:tetratricopeptide (TPR) repeat protein